MDQTQHKNTKSWSTHQSLGQQNHRPTNKQGNQPQQSNPHTHIHIAHTIPYLLDKIPVQTSWRNPQPPNIHTVNKNYGLSNPNSHTSTNGCLTIKSMKNSQTTFGKPHACLMHKLHKP